MRYIIFIIFLICLSVTMLRYKRRNPNCKDRTIIICSVVCIIAYILLAKSIIAGSYNSAISKVESYLCSSEYAEAYEETKGIDFKDEDKSLKQDAYLLYSINNKYNEYIRSKPLTWSDINKNKASVNLLINLNNYLVNNENKVITSDAKDEYNKLKSKEQNEIKKLGLTNLSLDSTKIAILLNNKYKSYLAAKQKAFRLAREKKRQQELIAKQKAALIAKQKYSDNHPANLKNLCSYIISNIKNSYSSEINSVEIFDGYDGSIDNTLMFSVSLNDGIAVSTSAKMIVTDMIFMAYKKTFENNLNTQSVVIHVFGPDGTKGLTTGLGRLVAQSNKSTITSNTASSYGGTNFVNFLKKYNIDAYATSDPAKECFANGSYSDE